MTDDEEVLARFAIELQGELEIEAAEEGQERALAEVFTELMLDVVMNAGEAEEARPCFHSARGVEVSGYGVEDDVLNLFITIYDGATPAATVGKRDIESAFKRAWSFWEQCRDHPYYERIEESSDAWDMARHLSELAEKETIRRVQIFLLAGGRARIEYLEDDEIDGIELRRSVWDLRRLHRLRSSGLPSEPIEIDFERDFGEPLPCVEAPPTGDSYEAFFAVIPGAQLARIYDRYGPRLLELNVRSFLQARGKVNRGIRDTLVNDPSKFLAYNNGISATATDVELADRGGGRVIRSLKEFQIVNGGQTTASIHRAFRSGVPLADVLVQAKITAASHETLTELVPKVSRFANSQNRVSEADLHANDPFQVAIESLSRKVWVPATARTKQQTRWFYERARGQYADALNRESTPAKRRKFRATNPTRQKITKTDLAKFEATWDQRPHVVSRGAQKNFAAFMADRSERNLPEPDERYFRRLVAKAILFKTAERVVSAQDFGGYRANIVAYSLARLGRATSQQIDLERIWTEQAIGEELEEAIAEISHLVFDVLTKESRPTANVTEWAKREQCWKEIASAPYSVPESVKKGLIRLKRDAVQTEGSPVETPDEDPLVTEIRQTDAEYWFALSNWAKETGNLQPWQRGIAYSIGKLLAKDRAPSFRQARQAKLMKEEAESLGFASGEASGD